MACITRSGGWFNARKLENSKKTLNYDVYFIIYVLPFSRVIGTAWTVKRINLRILFFDSRNKALHRRHHSAHNWLPEFKQ